MERSRSPQGVDEGTWEVVAGLVVADAGLICPHVVERAGQRRLPHGVKGYAECGYAEVVLCYDCIEEAVRVQCPTWAREEAR
jgi:hypothetical protein